MKTLDEHFIDWESDTFGFGYGTGEQYTLPALRRFFALCHHVAGVSYDHQELEREFGPLAAWLLIDALCNADILEYGTSPRFGWPTEKGHRLKAYIESKTDEELYEIVTNRTENDVPCYRDHCNCDDGPCRNPFWLLKP